MIAPRNYQPHRGTLTFGGKPVPADTVKHLDGIPWNQAGVPPVDHECWAQTDGWIGPVRVQRCPCGGSRGGAAVLWATRNTRKVDA